MRLLRDEVLIKPAEHEEKIGDFYIPLVAQQSVASGNVVLPGPKATTVKQGDEVYFEKGKWVNFKLDGEPLLVVKEKNILYILE